MGEHQILLLEDSALGQKHICRLLEQLDVRVTPVADSRAVSGKALAADKIDLVIVDADFLDLDIRELGNRLQREVENHVPFVVLSSLTDVGVVDNIFGIEAAAFVDKNEAEERLAVTVQRLLTRRTYCRDRLVLVVDDSPVVRKAVCVGLQKNCFQVIAAGNGKEACDILTNTRPDIILSDIDMPEMDGFALCENIQADPLLRDIPFVVMSSHDNKAHLLRMLQLGASAYIVKPFTSAQLTSLVEQSLCDQFQLLRQEKEGLEADQRALLATITSLVAALEARDPYTRGHSESVAGIIANMLQLSNGSKEEVEQIRLAGLLHDIGKIGIRDHLLLKSGKLSREEFAIIKTHPAIGAKILSPIPSFLDMIPLVKQHHERFDGKGYPEGIRGKGIHPWARMTAVADTYDALTSDRPYRQGMAQGKALQIIEDVSGSQLCPDSVELFFYGERRMQSEELRVQN